jgi:hypothetical protein
MPHRILEHLAHSADDLVDRAVGQAAASALVSAPGPRVDVLLHQRRAKGGCLVDRVALAQQRVDHVVDVARRDRVDGLVSEVVDRNGQPPSEVSAPLVRVHSPLSPVVVAGGRYLEGVGSRGLRNCWGAGGRISVRREPLAARNQLGDELAFLLHPLFGPPLPLAAEMNGHPLFGPGRWVAPGHLQPERHSAICLASNDGAYGRTCHQRGSWCAGLTLILRCLQTWAAPGTAPRTLVPDRWDRTTGHGRRP